MIDPARTIILLAPLSGTLLPLSQAPDPVFARKMAGEGVALMPSSNILLSPCAGTVTHLHPSSHALTITDPYGLQILLHVGIETVALGGKGFEALVAVGDKVKAGDMLLRFDLAHVTRAARSPMTMMVIANGELVDQYKPATGVVTAGADVALEVRLRSYSSEAVARSDAKGSMEESSPILIRNPLGLHARPAAVLANRAKRFFSDILLIKAGREANAKSVISIMGLDVKGLDRITVRAAGPDAGDALGVLVPLLESGLGDELHAPAAHEEKKKEQPRSGDAATFYGVAASPGICAGTLFHLRRAEITTQEQGGSIEDEENAFEAALSRARNELGLLQKRLREKADVDKAAIFAAHEELLDDPELLRSARNAIAAGESAAHAWQRAFTAQADNLAHMDNALLANRAADVRDAGQRVLALLSSRSPERLELPPDAILVAEELTPSETAELDAGSIRGVCTTTGSASSHAAILARAMGIPAIAAIDPRILETADGTPAVIDGENGVLRLNPDETEKQRIQIIQEESAARQKKELGDAAGPAITLDGHRILVSGNIGSIDNAREVMRQGGDGVGLLRSEFLFLKRAEPPGEKEQADAYRAIAAVLGPEKDLVVRTLDVGGDKGLAYLPLPPEDNPFLGLRGIRLSLTNKELFIAQVRAILSAAQFARLHIMFPMVARVEDLREARDIVERERAALGITAPVAIGIMVEVPSAALLAENLAAEADFFSIGTNDLTQYTLAMDRGNARLAGMADALHPAVLRLISMTVQGAHRQGKWVGVCAGVAGDPAAVPLLVGLGVDKLSVSPVSIPSVKSRVRGLSKERCAILAADALTMLTAFEVRAYVKFFLGKC